MSLEADVSPGAAVSGVGETVADAKDCGLQPDTSSKPMDPKSPKKYKAWDKEEMMLLRKGVQRHGVGNWETIRQDPDFALLKLRTGVQIKDKWRNLVKFRHLTEEEKLAVANRANKINRRAGRSSSFTFGTAQDAPIKAEAAVATLGGAVVCDRQDVANSLIMGRSDQARHMQSLAAYSKAQQDRSQAELEVQDAQAAYDQANTQLSTAQQSNVDTSVVERYAGVASQAKGNLILTKHRLSLARAIEDRLRNTLHLHSSNSTDSSADFTQTTAGSVASSADSAALGNLLAAHIGKEGLQMRPNLAAYGRSQSLDDSSFPRIMTSSDSLGSPEFSPEQYSMYPDNCSDGLPNLSKLVTRPGTRSPRRLSGSMPSSPLGKARSSGIGRLSGLMRSGSQKEEYDMPNSVPLPGFQHLGNSFSYNASEDGLGGTADDSMGLNYFFGSDAGGQVSSVDLQSTSSEPNGMLGFFSPSSSSVNTSQPYLNHLPVMNGVSADAENSSATTIDGQALPFNAIEYSSPPTNMTPTFYPAQVVAHGGMLKNEEGQQVPAGQDTPWTTTGFETYYGQMGNTDASSTPCSDALMNAMDDFMGVDTLQEFPGME